MQLRGALESQGIGLINSDGRQRIMIWADGKSSSPVAPLFRSGKRPRVLFPNGTEDNVSESKLAGIPDKIFKNINLK